MKQMKKMIALLLVMIMVFSLAACRRQSKPEQTETTSKIVGDIAPEDTSDTPDDKDTDTDADKDVPSDGNDDSDLSGNQDPDEGAELIGVWKADVSAGAFLNSLREKMDTDLLKYLTFDEIMIHVELTLRKDFTYTLEVDKDAIEATKENIIHTLRIGIPNVLLDLSKYSDEEILEIMKQRGLDIEKELSGKLTGSFWFEDGKLYYTIDTSEIDLDQFAVIEINVGEFTVIEMSKDGQIQIENAFLPIIFQKG